MDNLKDLLKTWRTLNHHLHLLNEEQLKVLLDMEIAGKRRYEVLKRLHQRYSTERTNRERIEILRVAQP